ncbi:hypothetical protein EJB05_30201, partial [Eragrostis curvula]
MAVSNRPSENWVCSTCDQRDKDGFTQLENKLATDAHDLEMPLKGRLTPRKSMKTSLVKWPERCIMGERLLPLPFYVKIVEIGMDLHTSKTSCPEKWPKRCPMDEGLLSLLLYIKIQELRMDLHRPKID